MNKKHKAIIFSTAIIPFMLAIFVSTSSISSGNQNEQQESWDTIVIKNNQAKIVLDAHLYMDEKNIPLNDKGNKKNLKSSYNTHKSFAASMVVNLGEEFSMKADEMKGYKFSATPLLQTDESILFSTNIKFDIDGNTININPGLAIRRHDTGHIILNDDKGRYRFELYITVRE